MIRHIVFDHDGTLVSPCSYPRQLFEGIYQWVAQLSTNDELSLYVWTARDRRSTLETLKNLEILHFFKDISTANDGVPKPSADGLETMLFGVDPKEVVVIGDSYIDILGAKHFGCKSIGVLWMDPSSSDGKETLEHFKADKICFSVSECQQYLDKLIKEG